MTSPYGFRSDPSHHRPIRQWRKREAGKGVPVLRPLKGTTWRRARGPGQPAPGQSAHPDQGTVAGRFAGCDAAYLPAAARSLRLARENRSQPLTVSSGHVGQWIRGHGQSRDVDGKRRLRHRSRNPATGRAFNERQGSAARSLRQGKIEMAFHRRRHAAREIVVSSGVTAALVLVLAVIQYFMLRASGER